MNILLKEISTKFQALEEPAHKVDMVHNHKVLPLINLLQKARLIQVEEFQFQLSFHKEVPILN